MLRANIQKMRLTSERMTKKIQAMANVIYPELQTLANMIAAEADKKLQTAVKDYECGMNDCKNGIYDKWYRYHHPYDGRAYDLGWCEQNKTTQNETVRFLNP